MEQEPQSATPNTSSSTMTRTAKAAKASKRPKKKANKKRRGATKRAKGKNTATRDKPNNPISCRLKDDIFNALNANVAFLKRSRSEVIRMAIMAFVTRNGTYQIPDSLGVVNDVFLPTVKDDVVELSNILQALAFSIFSYTEIQEPNPKLAELQDMLTDTKDKLEKIAGRVTRNISYVH